MPIKSYLVVPHKGQKEQLIEELKAYPECEVTSADNKEVLILLTETPNEEEDKSLFKKLNDLKNLQLLTLVSAFSE